ncbi:UDP-N-acetylmuramoylalanine--D-glutamate ligase [Marinospirillum celere]|uniref:UDP-N-acetylmuramoylalanine--D-glutamate ligase n=1 Tax=Marinospirillum celere TaxID=1122252 RepID=A0A1I1G5I6_9GAMM|nr:UDP-N-acetylmuramoyl-L-alanine--D-glutamate ligase [Marinospirillum celere]SFC04553.1 UDP-N-acetylmuramoylalanine--D-glutamate ligase [Marinospirillum celere]
MSGKTETEYLILGLGITGLSVARYLAQQQRSFAIADTRLHPPGLKAFEEAFPDAEIWLGPLDPELLCQAAHLVVSPGVSLEEPAIQQAKAEGVELLGDIELFSRAARKPVLAITGSNAKSTVTTLVGELAASQGLQVAVGGNIGVPALDLLAAPDPDLYVLELSSFQLETTSSLKAQGAALLNISEDHLDRYASMDDYVFAKQRIFHHARHVIFSREDERTRPIHGQLATPISFGLDQPPGEKDLGLRVEAGQTWIAQGKQLLFTLDTVPLAGEHGLLNVLAALALLTAAAIPLADLAPAIRRFQSLPHRCQKIASKQGVDYINDSKATNLGAALAAIQGLNQSYAKLWLIMGGEGKGQDFSSLNQALQAPVAGIALIGRDANLLAEHLPIGLPSWKADSLSEAVKLLAEQAKEGDAVLLAPACASFDQFTSYAERGEVFVQCVQHLPA